MRVNTTASERMCRAGPPTAPEPHDVRGGTTRPLLRPPAAMLAQHCAASAAPPRGCVRASRRGRGSAARFTSAAVASTAAAAPPPPRITHARQAGVQLRRAGWSDVKAVAEARGAARPLLSLSCVCSRRAAAPPAVRRSLRRRAWEHTQGCARARAPLCCAARSTPRRRVARRQSQRGGPERVFGHQLPRRHVTAGDQSHGAGAVAKGARPGLLRLRSLAHVSFAARRLTAPRDRCAGGGRGGDAARARHKARRNAARCARGREGAQRRRGRLSGRGRAGRAAAARRRGGAAVVAALGARAPDARPAVDVPARSR